MAFNQDPPRLKAPAGTCDTHMHIYDRRYPTAPTAPFTPPDALVADYLKVRARLGITRTVVVQPSTYGKDNRCTLAAIAALGDSARGIAVVDQTVTDAELDRLTKAGIRGIRFHMLPGGALPWDILETMAARVGNFGWHVQLQLDGRTLPDREPLLKRLDRHAGGRSRRQIPRADPGRPSWLQGPAAAARQRPHLGEALRALRMVEGRPAELHRRRATGVHALPRRARPHAVGDQLAASDAGPRPSPTTPGCSTCCWNGCPTKRRATRRWSTIRRGCMDSDRLVGLQFGAHEHRWRGYRRHLHRPGRLR